MTLIRRGSVMLLVLAAAACESANSQPGNTAGSEGPPPVRVELIGRDGNRVGTAVLTEEGHGVRITIEVAGLTPGRRGIHIHETGKCDPPGFETAGAHFDPLGTRHGIENPNGPHAGDLPNIVVQPDGAGRNSPLNPYVTLGPGPNSLLREGGTALVLHADADDYYTHPSGNSGERIACGVIQAPANRE